MAFWSKVFGLDGEGVTPNDTPGDPVVPGDPDGLVFEEFDTPSENRSLEIAQPSAWSGWPGGWSMPSWEAKTTVSKLVDIAWACIDLNANIMASMPVYQTRGGAIVQPTSWMTNPDPTIYTSWHEFAKQLFWDFQLGEAFVLPMAYGSDGKPQTFRVMPPWLVSVEMEAGTRSYKIGSKDVTDEILHIRYQSSTTDAHGHGPLETARDRQVQIGLLQRYASTLAETGGVPLYWMEINRNITASEGRDLLDRWIETRTKNAGQPALVANGAKLNQAKAMSAHDMSLIELSQTNESRIAILLGVPPFLVGLGVANGGLTYSNIADLFDFHDRSSLRPKVTMAMEALSAWALPSTRSVELNRDDYTRLPFDKRVAAYKTLWDMQALSSEEIRIMERFYGNSAASVLTGGDAEGDTGGTFTTGPSPTVPPVRQDATNRTTGGN